VRTGKMETLGMLGRGPLTVPAASGGGRAGGDVLLLPRELVQPRSGNRRTWTANGKRREHN